MKYILVIGDTGYIGSHLVLELLKSNYYVIGVSKSNISEILNNLLYIGNGKFTHHIVDINNYYELANLFNSYDFQYVIHLAGCKSNSIDSCNAELCGVINLLQILRNFNNKRIIYASSSSIYGNTHSPISIVNTPNPINVYGNHKLAIENKIIKHIGNNYLYILRIFNVVGAHTSGLLGENIHSDYKNLFTNILDVVYGVLPELKVFGGVLESKDGTVIRDYIHVLDVCDSICKLLGSKNYNNVEILNIGRGIGVSILQVLDVFTSCLGGLAIPYKIIPITTSAIGISYCESTNQCYYNFRDMVTTSIVRYTRNYLK